MATAGKENETQRAGLARCEKELAELEAMGDDLPAWLSTLGQCDWMHEADIIAGRWNPHQRRRPNLQAEHKSGSTQ